MACSKVRPVVNHDPSKRSSSLVHGLVMVHAKSPVVAGLAPSPRLLQYPLTTLGLGPLHGNFTAINVAQAIILLPLFVFCYFMYRCVTALGWGGDRIWVRGSLGVLPGLFAQMRGGWRQQGAWWPSTSCLGPCLQVGAGRPGADPAHGGRGVSVLLCLPGAACSACSASVNLCCVGG